MRGTCGVAPQVLLIALFCAAATTLAAPEGQGIVAEAPSGGVPVIPPYPTGEHSYGSGEDSHSSGEDTVEGQHVTNDNVDVPDDTSVDPVKIARFADEHPDGATYTPPVQVQKIEKLPHQQAVPLKKVRPMPPVGFSSGYTSGNEGGESYSSDEAYTSSVSPLPDVPPAPATPKPKPKPTQQKASGKGPKAKPEGATHRASGKGPKKESAAWKPPSSAKVGKEIEGAVAKAIGHSLRSEKESSKKSREVMPPPTSEASKSAFKKTVDRMVTRRLRKILERRKKRLRVSRRQRFHRAANTHQQQQVNSLRDLLRTLRRKRQGKRTRQLSHRERKLMAALVVKERVLLLEKQAHQKELQKAQRHIKKHAAVVKREDFVESEPDAVVEEAQDEWGEGSA